MITSCIAPISTQMIETKTNSCSEPLLMYVFHCDITEPMSFTCACIMPDEMNSRRSDSFVLNCILIFSIYFDLMMNYCASPDLYTVFTYVGSLPDIIAGILQFLGQDAAS